MANTIYSTSAYDYVNNIKDQLGGIARLTNFAQYSGVTSSTLIAFLVKEGQLYSNSRLGHDALDNWGLSILGSGQFGHQQVLNSVEAAPHNPYQFKFKKSALPTMAS